MMTSNKESNKKFFFFFVSIITSVILGLFYLSVTPRNGTVAITCHGKLEVLTTTDLKKRLDRASIV